MSDGQILRYFIEIRQPNCVPAKKGPFPPDIEQATEFIRDCFSCRPPETQITLISLTWDHDLWMQDGREHLTIWDALKPKPRRRKAA